MKKAMWVISFIPLVITLLVIPYMPESVPLHYNLRGEVDGWGSPKENLIVPVFILALTLFYHLLIYYFEKRAAKATQDKERASVISNARVIGVISVAQAAMFGIMQCFILYGAYQGAETSTGIEVVDIGKVSCILLGLFLIVIGNVMPKTRRNGTIGLRISWSMYNDTTWRKSNKFAAYALIIAGILVIVTGIFTKAYVYVPLMLVYIIAASIISVIYARKVYLEEKGKAVK